MTPFTEFLHMMFIFGHLAEAPLGDVRELTCKQIKMLWELLRSEPDPDHVEYVIIQMAQVNGCAFSRRAVDNILANFRHFSGENRWKIFEGEYNSSGRSLAYVAIKEDDLPLLRFIVEHHPLEAQVLFEGDPAPIEEWQNASPEIIEYLRQFADLPDEE